MAGSGAGHDGILFFAFPRITLNKALSPQGAHLRCLGAITGQAGDRKVHRAFRKSVLDLKACVRKVNLVGKGLQNIRYWLAVSALVNILPSLASAEQPQANTLLLEAKNAMGGPNWNQIQMWHETGVGISSDGVRTRYDSYYDFSKPRFRDTRISGDETQTTLFDGNVFWFFKNSKLEKKDTSAAMTKVGREGSFLVTFSFFFPDHFPATERYEGTRTEEGKTFDVVGITPTGLQEFDLWIDRKTHFIERYVTEDGRFTTILSNFRPVNGVYAPFTQISSGTKIYTESIEFLPLNQKLFKAQTN